MAKSLLEQKMSTTAPTGDAKWDKLAAAVEIIVIALGGAATATYVSVPVAVTASTTIPVGTLGWSFVWNSGGGTVAIGAVPIQLGQVYSGGGYGGFGLKTAIPITITGAPACILLYDILA